MTNTILQLRCGKCQFRATINNAEELKNFVAVASCVSCNGAKQFKCPKCGYLVKAVKININPVSDSQKHLEKLRKEQEDRKKELEKEKKSLTKEWRDYQDEKINKET